ncbi:MAG: winged helix-turn-helix transcriptional regulator [Nitrososphaerales archaeon]
MKVYFIREPTKQQKKHEAKWSKTTEKILNVIKSKGEIDTRTLAEITGYKLGTINAQVSILRRLGLVTTREHENLEVSLCPPHQWSEEVTLRPYGDNIIIRKCRICGKVERAY